MPNIDTWFNTADAKRFYLPSRVFAGKNMFLKALDLVDHYRSVLVVYDAFFEGGIHLAHLQDRLGDRIIASAKVTGMPRAEDAETLGVAHSTAPPEAIVVLGGGSSTDFAKAVMSHMLFGKLDMRPNVGHPTPHAEVAARRPALIAITTTAGSGAETSRYSVVYGQDNDAKQVARSFTLIADWVFLDPAFLRDCPVPVLLNCAFDVCVHYLETLVCQYESSTYSRGLSTQGIITVMHVLDRVLFQNNRDETDLTDLMTSATMAGGALTNVRTGHIHEAAGALLEMSDLNHGETLFVFFRTFVEDYQDTLAPLLAPALLQLSASEVLPKEATVSDFLDFWDRCYAESGLTARITQIVKTLPTMDAAFNDHIFNRTYDDKVWMEKEGPVRHTPDTLRALITQAFAHFEGTA